MEVHAHSHTPRKKWTHYFWEFLMLFLAVFCGFLAENKREHMIEHQRARSLAKNLYQELYNDSVSISTSIANRNSKEASCTYFINYVKDSSLENLSPLFLPAYTTALIQTQYIIFEPNDGVLNQLRNSGELRYFKNIHLQTELGKLSVKISHVRSRNEREYSYVELYTRPFMLKHFDFKWYDQITENGTLSFNLSLNSKAGITTPGQIINVENFNRQEAQQIASYYLLILRATRKTQYKQYSDVNHRTMELLREEYDVE